MKRGQKLLLSLLGMIALTQVSRAVVDDAATSANNGQADASSDQPYSAIWTRNVFDLKPPPPTVEQPKTNLPPPNVKLVGILTIFGKKQAMLTVQDQIPGHPPGKEECYNLMEGERRGGLEVLEIDPKGETVKIKNDELASTLHFETNRPAGGPPTAPQNMAGGFHQPNFNPPGVPMNNNGSMPLPNRNIRTPGVSPQGASMGGGYSQPNLGGVGYGSGYVSPTGAAGLSVPTSPYNQTSTQPVSTPQAPAQVLSPEEQVANMLLQNQYYKNNPGLGVTLPPPPPIPGVAELENGEAPPAPPTTTVPSLPTVPGLPIGVRTAGSYH